MKNCLKLLPIICLLALIPLSAKAQTVADLQAIIKSLLLQVQQLQIQLQQLSSQQAKSAGWCHTFNTDLKIGDRGSEVSALQSALAKEGFSIPDSETPQKDGDTSYNNRFMEGTASAVSAFQEKYKNEILIPNGLSSGTGYFGPATRAKINSLYKCNISTANSAISYVNTPTANQPVVSQPIVQMNYLKKQALVFSIDQVWINGIVNVQDMTSLARIIENLKSFQQRYEVYALLNPSNTDQQKVFAVLDKLTANGIPFILDQQSSDSNHKDTVISPFDPYHGVALSLEQLKAYKQKYGDKFAGIRFMEVFAANYTILACQKLGVNWCDYDKTYLPQDNFYQKSIAETYIKFAKDNEMFVLWSDFYWSVYHPWDFDINVVKQSQNENELKELLAAYPNTVVVTLANNWPVDGARSGNYINTWPDTMKPFVQTGAFGFGLSDQSWMCSQSNGCPASEIKDWALTAFAKGAKLVQFEPVSYFWNLPDGVMEKWVAAGQNPTGYMQDAAWSNRGYPNSNLTTIASALGISISSGQTILKNNSSCVSVDIPDMVKPGSSFTGKVTVKNVGNTTWAQNSSTNPNPYRLGAADFKLPPYQTSIWGSPKIELPTTQVGPNESVTFTINTVAPATEGAYTFGWQMLHDYKEWFGDACSKTITISTKVPPPSNATAICPPPGNNATVSWSAPSGYNSFFLRVKEWPNPADGSSIIWNDNFNGTSYSFTSIPGKSYNWWVHTKDNITNAPSDAIGTTFTCPSN